MKLTALFIVSAHAWSPPTFSTTVSISDRSKTIVDLAATTPDLSTLVAALKAADLVGTLSGNGPFTVFAPTNEAFAALPAGLVTSLLKPENKAELADLLTYHVVSGAVPAKDLSDKEMIKTVEGKNVTVRLAGGGVFINSAKVTTADIDASNGVIHIIDSVLIPRGFQPPKPTPKTIVDLAIATPELSTLVAALKAADLVDILSSTGPFTVFAPTNKAFAALPAGVLTKLLKPENKAELADLLTYHVVSGAVPAKDLSDKEMIKTVEGKNVKVRLSGSQVWSDNADVVIADIDASNGVVHIIDAVLKLPNGCDNWGFSQCGGKEYSGLKCCPSGFACEEQNQYYSQCKLPSP